MSTIDNYITPNKLLCSVVGIKSNYENSSTLSKTFTRLRLIFTIISTVTLFIPQTLQIMINWGNINVLTGVGCVWLAVTMLMFKLFYVLLRRKKMENMYLIIRELWEVTSDPDEKQIYENTAWQAKIFTIIFCCVAFSNNVLFTGAAAMPWIKSYSRSVNETNIVRDLPFDIWYGFDVSTSPNYEIVFCWQTITALICNIAILGLDSTMMTMTLHICGQFKLIQNWFRKIGYKINEEQMINVQSTTQNVFLENVRSNIDRCIQHHQRMIEIANDMEDLINPIIFVQFVQSASVICLSGYAVTTVTYVRHWIKFSNYLMAMLIELAAWCWPGEVILQESGIIGDVVYLEIPWYKLPKSYQADLILVIIRSQKRCQITAAKFQTMSVEKFGHVLSTAASYFTLLRQLNGD
uniref:Odorant receptor n=1 Tax=Sirex nitobei TaxID=1602346 RepID=A0A857N3C7_9HYME|nr:odorant receptor 3 [Sirex nitobei]